jgi:serine/threonine protein kinase
MSTLRHPNVVLFMAACTKPPKLCIVMEYMALGSLYDVRHSQFVWCDVQPNCELISMLIYMCCTPVATQRAGARDTPVSEAAHGPPGG